LLEEIINQTRYYDENKFINLIYAILGEILNLPDLEKNVDHLAQIIFLCIHIIIKNSDRNHLIWEEFSCFLSCIKPNYFLENENAKEERAKLPNVLKEILEKFEGYNFKKKSKRFFLSSFSKYCQLKMCLTFLHQSDTLINYDSHLKKSIVYLDECSIFLLEEILEEIHKVLHLDQILDKPKEVWIRMIEILDYSINVLSKKNLENVEVINLCQKLFDLISDFVLKLSFVNYQQLVNLLPVILFC
jgi:hypothetical protein